MTKMCKEELDAMQEALENYGPYSSQYRAARGRYLRCYEHIAEGRASHAAAWDERLYLLQKELQQAWEQLMKGVPPRPTCGGKSSEARSKIFANKENAMIFSKKLEEAFNKTGVKLADDETYACFVCVVKKPQYASEALALDPLGQKVEGAPRVNYIMEPAIMESVMSTIEQDTIKYESKVRK
jgi:hypothetical protein